MRSFKTIEEFAKNADHRYYYTCWLWTKSRGKFDCVYGLDMDIDPFYFHFKDWVQREVNKVTEVWKVPEDIHIGLENKNGDFYAIPIKFNPHKLNLGFYEII